MSDNLPAGEANREQPAPSADSEQPKERSSLYTFSTSGPALQRVLYSSIGVFGWTPETAASELRRICDIAYPELKMFRVTVEEISPPAADASEPAQEASPETTK